jgi:hypothetical protein
MAKKGRLVRLEFKTPVVYVYCDENSSVEVVAEMALKGILNSANIAPTLKPIMRKATIGGVKEDKWTNDAPYGYRTDDLSTLEILNKEGE